MELSSLSGMKLRVMKLGKGKVEISDPMVHTVIITDYHRKEYNNVITF